MAHAILTFLEKISQAIRLGFGINISWKDFLNDSIDGIWYDIHEIGIWYDIHKINEIDI